MESDSCKKSLLLLPPKATSREPPVTNSQSVSLDLHHYNALRIE